MEITRTFIQTDVTVERYRLKDGSVEMEEKQSVTIPGKVSKNDAAVMLTLPETLVKVINYKTYKRTFALDVDEFLRTATMKKEELFVEVEEEGNK